MDRNRKISTITFGRTSLKIIAVCSMLCDHIAYVFLAEGDTEQLAGWSVQNWLYLLLRMIGRISFPIFCFVLVQGFLTTRNVCKYMGRLFLFALFSEIPYDLVFSGRIIDWSQQNVMFTMLLGIFVLYGMQQFSGNLWWQAGIALFGCIAAFCLQTDYSAFGVGCIIMMYLLSTYSRNWLYLMAIPFAVMGNIESFAILSLPICGRYDPEKKERRLPRYFFYLFYPVHLFVLWGIWTICQKIG